MEDLQPDQEVLPNKDIGRHYYQIQFFTGTAEDGIWLYASGIDRTRDLTWAESDRWIHLLDDQNLPYRVYMFHEVTERSFLGGSEPYGN